MLISKQSPEVLVENALKGFQKAQEQMDKAANQIAEQKRAAEVKIAALNVEVASCDDASSRLSRIADRLKEFLA